jgi:hypothetical protein
MSGIAGLVKIAELRKRILFTLVMLAVCGLIVWASFQRPVDAAASDP